MIKSILSGLPALQKGAQEQVVLNKYLFEAFYTYVDFLCLFGYSWPLKYKSVHWLVFEWQWFHNPYGKSYPITETDIHHLFLPSTLFICRKHQTMCIMFRFVSGEFFLQLLQDAWLRYFHRRKAAPPSHRCVKLYELMRNQFWWRWIVEDLAILIRFLFLGISFTSTFISWCSC